MVIVVSGVFVLALMLVAATIIGTFIGSAPQISAVIAGRSGPVKGSRTVHIGAVRQTGWTASAPAAANIVLFKPRPETATATATAPQICADDLALAA